MGKDSISYEDLIQIVQLIESSSRFGEFRLKVGDIELDMRAKRDRMLEPPDHAAAAAQTAVPGREISSDVATAVADGAPCTAPVAQFAAGSVLIRSPTVGTFYRAPEPGAPPFVEVGSRVTADSTTCIIEVMKLMSSIPAEHSGVVTHILVNDAQLVEAEQVLMVIDTRA